MIDRRLPLALTSATALLLALVVLPATQSVASDPQSSTLTVPGSPGKTVSAAYTGTAPAGVLGAAGGCTEANSDAHAVALKVPAGGPTATLTFAVEWDPAGADNDLVLTVLDPAGKQAGSSDSGAPAETVTVTDLKTGTYTALLCGFVNETPQPYAGVATITTSAAPGPGPPAGERGLEVGARLVTGPPRSQGESAAFADASGVLYSCGTNGASNGTDHGSVSVDGGQTWRPLGTGPIGETGTAQGGGDCAIGTGQDKNAEGKRQLAFIGLGPLTGFSTFSSPDNGRTLQRSPSQNGLEPFNQTTLVDRQWLVFTDDKTVFLNYNAAVASVPGQPSGKIIQKSTDGGLTYGPQYSAATDGGRLGQIRAIRQGVVPGVPKDKDVVYFPYSSGNVVKLAMSLDGGETFSQCLAVDAGISPDAGFVAADHDRAGNIYVTYSEKGGGRDTYLVALRAADVAKCKGPNPVGMSALNKVDPGFTKKIRITRAGVETPVMPWVAAGGAPGRVAVAFYGTPTVGDPDLGDFKASWNVYVNQTLDAFAAQPAVEQVKATTHPNHYDSICLNGLQCTVDMADRTLVDYFTMSYDEVSGKLLVVFNQAAKVPDAATGNIAAPVALVQRAGPSNGGKALPAAPKVVRTSSADVKGDAFARWTTSDGLLGSPTAGLPGENLPATDLLGVKVGPEVDLATGAPVADGGFTVTMSYDDLSPKALASALSTGQARSLVYLFRFFDGYQPGGATAFFEGGKWRFGYDDYTTSARNPQ
ncbi:MAG: exo-alpha-sialidase, partial [Pseudorhodobacter sp.]|nr:exo-alpha-sialidase [Frankiaceae bacterium]